MIIRTTSGFTKLKKARKRLVPAVSSNQHVDSLVFTHGITRGFDFLQNDDNIRNESTLKTWQKVRRRVLK